MPFTAVVGRGVFVVVVVGVVGWSMFETREVVVVVGVVGVVVLIAEVDAVVVTLSPVSGSPFCPPKSEY